MELIDLNLTEGSSDSLNNLSDISFSPESVSRNVQRGGGLFSGMFGGSNLDKAVLEAASLKKNECVEFLIDKDLFKSFDYQDDAGNTLLHYLVSTPTPNMGLIKKIISRPDVKSFINKQNKNGDTPLILAVTAGQHDVADALVAAGADKSIKNKKGLHVDTETPVDVLSPAVKKNGNTTKEPRAPTQGQTQLSAQSLSAMSPTYTIEATGDAANEILAPIIALMRKKQITTDTSDAASNVTIKSPILLTATATDMGNASTMKEADTDDFTKMLQEQLGKTNIPKNDTSDIFIGKQTTAAPATGGMHGGGCGCGPGVEAERLICDIQNYFNKQSGGAKQKTKPNGDRSGKRTIRHVDSAISEQPKRERGEELSRIINDQTDEIIKRSIKNIQTIITENKSSFKGLKGDEQTARAVKAILWKKVREEHPEIKSPLDIAVEMEKMVTKDSIKEIGTKPIKEMMDTLQKHYEEKQQQKPKERPERKERKSNDSVSATSTANVPVETNISETSI